MERPRCASEARKSTSWRNLPGFSRGDEPAKLNAFLALALLWVGGICYTLLINVFPPLREFFSTCSGQWNPLSFLWTLWIPENASYTGKKTSVSWFPLKNVLFWAIFFALKLPVDFFFIFGNNYLLESTFVLWNEADRWLAPVFGAYIMMFLTWLPFLCLFLVNNQIFFTILEMFWGFAIGWHRRVGKVKSWDTMRNIFCTSLAVRFNKRLVSASAKKKMEAAEGLLRSTKSISGKAPNADYDIDLHSCHLPRVTPTATHRLTRVVFDVHRQGAKCGRPAGRRALPAVC